MAAIEAPAPVQHRSQADYTNRRNELIALYGDEMEPTSAYYNVIAPESWLARPVYVPPTVRDVAPVEKPRRKRSRKELA